MPKGRRVDGGVRMTYARAVQVMRDYQARVTAAELKGLSRTNKRVVEREAEVCIARFKVDAPYIVSDTLAQFARGSGRNRTQRRLDAFALTGTPIPQQWIAAETETETMSQSQPQPQFGTQSETQLESPSECHAANDDTPPIEILGRTIAEAIDRYVRATISA